MFESSPNVTAQLSSAEKPFRVIVIEALASGEAVRAAHQRYGNRPAACRASKKERRQKSCAENSFVHPASQESIACLMMGCSAPRSRCERLYYDHPGEAPLPNGALSMPLVRRFCFIPSQRSLVASISQPRFCTLSLFAYNPSFVPYGFFGRSLRWRIRRLMWW